VVEEGIVSDIVPNPNPETSRENGFTGTAICHNTVLLKSIAYGQAAAKENLHDLDYTLDVIRKYVQTIRNVAAPFSIMIEFWTEESLAKTLGFLDANYLIYSQSLQATEEPANCGWHLRPGGGWQNHARSENCQRSVGGRGGKCALFRRL